MTWAAGITAAAAIGYVVLGSYFPSFGWTRKMDKDVVAGLYNRYGNDCFANCVIQVFSLHLSRGLMMKSLAGIPSFREYLRERVERNQRRDMNLSKSLMDLLNGTPIMEPMLIGSTQLTCSEGEDKICGKCYRGVGRHV